MVADARDYEGVDEPGYSESTSQIRAPGKSFVILSSKWDRVLVPYAEMEQTPTNKNGEVWGNWAEPVKQIGFQTTHGKQSKFYLLPQEPEIFDSKERLMVELSLHLYLINLRER